MRPLNIYLHCGYRIGALISLSEGQLSRITKAFESPAGQAEAGSVLSGRKPVKEFQLEGFGRIVVKQYYRGGLLRHLNRKKYLRTGKLRSQKEFDMLLHMEDIGVNAPTPVFFAGRGRFFYETWLATQTIENASTLAELSLKDINRTRRVWNGVSTQIERLIQAAVHHVDLHPGNIIVDDKDRAFILDFDKAYIFKGPLAALRLKYLKRWQRAIVKYGLPEAINIQQL